MKMADLPNGTDVGVLQWVIGGLAAIFGIATTIILNFVHRLDGRITKAADGARSDDDKIWAELSSMKAAHAASSENILRDIQPLATRRDVEAMGNRLEARIAEISTNRKTSRVGGD